jgi:hypothetical protein
LYIYIKLNNLLNIYIFTIIKMEYNKETKTLTILPDYNEKLKDIPEETEIIIFLSLIHI